MPRARTAVTCAGVAVLALAVATGTVLVAQASTATSTPVPTTADPATAGEPPSDAAQHVREVTLATGERVRVADTGDRSVVSIDPQTDPAAAPAATRLRVRSAAGHTFVIPDSALPELGRQLELSQLDVSRSGAGEPETVPSADPAYPMATLTVRGLDMDGASASAGSVAVDNVDDLQRFAAMQSFGESGQVSFSVPIGHYSIAAEVATVGPDGTIASQALLFLPEVEVTAPGTTVEVDARTATAEVPLPTTPRASDFEQFVATYARECANGLVASVSYITLGGRPTLYVTPTSPVTLGTVHWYTYFRMNAPADQAEPYLYDLLFPAEGAVPAEHPTSVEAGSLATVTADYHSDIADHTIRTYRASAAPWEIAPMRFSSAATAPLRRTEYVSALADTRWASAVVWNPEENNGIDFGPWTVFQSGEQRGEQSLSAPLVPGVDMTTTGTTACGSCRQGDDLWLNITPWSAAGRIVGGLSETETLSVSSPTRLYADGTLLAEGTAPNGTLTLPAAEADLRLELETTKSASWTTTSTRSSTVWTWHSQPRTGTLPEGRVCADHTRDCVFEPLLFLAYDAGVDLANTVAAGSPIDLGISAMHQPFDPSPEAGTLTLAVSGDDGTTWTTTAVVNDGGGHFSATVVPVAGTEFLSFRANASDSAGNTIEQTVIRAVKVSG
ncbi:MAG: hypothetical protein HKP61_04285 [Dactylosporangium sp.]|nr:hypothetical protein [Dactylosporangium sp.]NNJ60171.1 hypothetical protein [Dactylosporangium sp.]